MQVCLFISLANGIDYPTQCSKFLFPLLYLGMMLVKILINLVHYCRIILFLTYIYRNRGFWFCSELAPFTDDVFFITGKEIKSISIL